MSSMEVSRRQLGELAPAVWAAALAVWGYDLLFAVRHPGADWNVIFGGVTRFVHHQPVYASVAGTATFNHPPSSLLVLSPLAILPAGAARVAFVALSVVVFVVGLHLVTRGSHYRALLILLAGVAAPVTGELALGNDDLLAAGLIALGLASGSRRRRIVLVALALSLKPTVWPVALAFGLSSVAILAVVAIVNGIGMLLIVDAGRFVHQVLPYLAHGQSPIHDVARGSVADALRELGTSNGVATAVATVGLVGSIVFVLALRSASGRDRAPLLILASLLFASYTLSPYAVYAVVAIPLLRIRHRLLDLVAAGVAVYLVGTNDSWGTASFQAGRLVAGFAILLAIGVAGLYDAAPERAERSALLAVEG